MGKIHLLFKKEDIDDTKIKQDKIVVVFDVLLATSTIVTALHFGAKEVIPVLNQTEALKEAQERSKQDFLLIGESGGRTLDGFQAPYPLDLQQKVKGKTVILSTTNGTVAINKAAKAKKVYIGSLLNNSAVADVLLNQHNDETIIVVCAGSANEFNAEDFYGAGHLITNLVEQNSSWKLTDSALAAYQFYLGCRNKGEEVLSLSRVGKMLVEHGFRKEMEYVAQQGIIDIVPVLVNKGTVVTSMNFQQSTKKEGEMNETI